MPIKAVLVAAGEDTSFALLDDGTVWAWGRGYSGELGVDLQGATNRYTPAPVPGLRDVTAIAGAASMAMAVLVDGTVRAWGALPTILTGVRPVYPGVFQPVLVVGLEHILHVTCGGPFGFALTGQGRVLGWGANEQGFLGLGRATAEPQPPTGLPTLKDVVSIEVGRPPRRPSRAMVAYGHGARTSKRTWATGCTATCLTPDKPRRSP